MLFINRIFTRSFRTLYARGKAFQLRLPMSSEEEVLCESRNGSDRNMPEVIVP